MRILSIILVLASFALQAAASTAADSLFSKANTAYVAGENATDAKTAETSYREAATNYKAAIDAGDISWAAYFNLGNAYCKTGEFGRAVNAYERAIAIDPARPEAAANMARARQTAGLQPVRPATRLDTWSENLPVRVWMWAAAIGGWCFLAALVLPFFYGGHKLATITATVSTFAFTAACLVGLLGWHLQAKWRVVVTPDAPMLAAPDAKASEVRKLGDATDVYVRRVYENWIFVTTEQGDEGWILTDNTASVWEK
jgi:tetratricopeptide (TPR) repeat protein